MAQPPQPDPIYFLITDLAASANGPGSGLSNLKQRIPFKKFRGKDDKDTGDKESKTFLQLYHFAPFKHWAVRIRDYCYEVNVYRTTEGKRDYRLNNRVHIDEWKRRCNDIHVSWEPIEVGATIEPDDVIAEQAQLVWKDRCQVKYKLWAQNCQNFAYCLYRRVAVDPDAVDEDVRRRWKGVPNRVTQLKTFAKRVAPMLGRGLMIEGLELGAEQLAIVGLEVVGLSLLGPVGEIILVTSIVGTLLLKKNKDTKWLNKVNKIMGKKPALTDDANASQNDIMTEIKMEEILKDMVQQAKTTEASPSGFTADHWNISIASDTATIDSLQCDEGLRYQGYEKKSVDRYARLGFTVEHVVAVLIEWDVSTGGGEEFNFNEADHELLIQSLLGRHGFDEVASSQAFVVPRKPLPKNAMTDHWVDLIEADVSVSELPARGK